MEFPGFLDLEPIYPPSYLGLFLVTYIFNSNFVLFWGFFDSMPGEAGQGHEKSGSPEVVYIYI